MSFYKKNHSTCYTSSLWWIQFLLFLNFFPFQLHCLLTWKQPVYFNNKPIVESLFLIVFTTLCVGRLCWFCNFIFKLLITSFHWFLYFSWLIYSYYFYTLELHEVWMFQNENWRSQSFRTIMNANIHETINLNKTKMD